MAMLLSSVIWALAALALAPPGAVGATSGIGEPVAQSNGNTGTTPDRVECGDAEGDLVPLCRAYSLITTEHVDMVTASNLAAQAAEYVRDAGLAARTDSTPPACPLPSAEFEQVCEEIDAVQDTASAVWEAIAGMVSLLDSQSFLWTNDRYALVKATSANIQTRIGIELALMDGDDPCEEVSTTCRPAIVDVHPGSPAETAGLQEGDVLVGLNGPLPSDLDCSDLPDLDSFDKDEAVAVEVTRGSQTVTETLQAAELTVPVARGRVVHTNVGYLRLDRFSSSAGTDTDTELARLTGMGIGALVLDLRDNPGGLVSSTVDTAGLFLPDPSVVMHLVYRSGDETLTAAGNAKAPALALLPMVIAVDGRSASGSEALTGALMDHERATVAGKRTYGKNTGQVVYELKNGDQEVIGVLRLTVIRWLTLLRRSVAGGIAPDIDMDLPGCLHPAEVARRAVAPLRPEVSGLAVTSAPVNGSAYTPGQTVQVTVSFASPVVVDVTDGTPTLDLRIGVTDRQAAYESGSGTADLRFEYTVANGETDMSGVKVRADSLATNGGTIRHPAGLDATLEHDGLGADPRHAVTSAVPTAIVLTIDPDTIREDASTTQISVTASLESGSGTHPDPLTVAVGLLDDPAQYTSTTVEITIPTGQVSQTGSLFVIPVNEPLPDGDRGVEVSGTLAGFTISHAVLTIEDDETVPDFGTDTTTRSVPENSSWGAEVGTPVAAVDPNGDTLTYTLDGPFRDLFAIDGSGQITVGRRTLLDYETLATYMLTVTATDPDNNADTVDVTITITDEEGGTVGLPGSQPVTDTELVATLMDPDGTVTTEIWTWERSSDRTVWEHLQTSASPAYTPSDSDVGKYLRATVVYRDPRGGGKEAHLVSGAQVRSKPTTTTTITKPPPTRLPPPTPTGPVEPPPPEPVPVPEFTDIEGNVHWRSVEAIAAAGITSGCGTDGTAKYCPDHLVTRAQMATFLTRVLDRLTASLEGCCPPRSETFRVPDGLDLGEGGDEVGALSGPVVAPIEPVLGWAHHPLHTAGRRLLQPGHHRRVSPAGVDGVDIEVGGQVGDHARS